MSALDGLFGLRRLLVSGAKVLNAAGAEVMHGTFNLLGGWTVTEGVDADGKKTLELTPPVGTGDVTGPVVSVNNELVAFDGITGKLIKTAGYTLAAILALISAVRSDRVEIFGGGTDGNLTTSTGTTTLTRDMYYDTITLSGDAVLDTNGFRVHCRALNATAPGTYSIRRNGIAGGNGALLVGGTGAVGLVRGTLGGSFFGGNGGAGTSAGSAGQQGFNGEGDLSAGGGNGGASPAGGDSAVGSGGAGGAARAAAQAVGDVFFGSFVRDIIAWTDRTVATLLGGGAGGAGGSTGGSYNLSTDKSGGGGGGGSGAGVLWIAAGEVLTSVNTPAGVIQAIGGRGGNAAAGSGANSGGSCGGAGGGGGKIQGYIGKVTGPTVVGFFKATGGAAGTASAPRGTGIAVAAGGGGSGGNITAHYLSTNTVAKATPAAPVGTAGGVSQLDLVAA